MTTSFSLRGLTGLVVASLVLSACAGVDLDELAEVPKLKRSDLKVHLAQTSKIYAGNQRLITTFHGEENRTVIPFKKIPKRLWQAVVAIEDERFFKHDGVDVKAIARAAVRNVSSGSIRQGGSTITQQYVKNVIIARDGRVKDTLNRKIEEAALSRQLEQRLTKKEILHRYLNTVYFGRGAYGVHAAAKTFFGVPAKKVTLKEAATLAALIRSPRTYDPGKHPKKAKRRRNAVIRTMRELGWIGETRAEKVQGYPLGAKPRGNRRYPAAYFVDYVKRLLTYHPRFKMLGKTPAQRQKMLFEGGLRIKTTVNLKMQRKAERAIKRVLNRRRDPYGAIVSIKPKNGHVKALVGGRNFFAKKKKRGRFAKLNLAIVAEPKLGRVGSKKSKKGQKLAPGTGRQAGSAFKPFVLAAAVDKGIPLYRTFPAPKCKTFPKADNGKPWEVCNYGGASFGEISIRQGTINSVNVLYAQLIRVVGPHRAVKLADKMGINTELLPVPSAVLGTNPVNALGMASAYATLASKGVARRPVAIKKIIDANGKVLFKANPRQKRVLSKGVAYVVTRTLQQVIQQGTGTRARIGRPAAGKTGTAQEYRDAWFVGYTPQLATSVWVGYPKASISMKPYCYTSNRMKCRPTRILVAGGTWPAQIWGNYMRRALKGKPARGFGFPGGKVRRITIDVRSGCRAQPWTPSSQRRTIVVPKGTRIPQPCDPPPAPPPSSSDASGGGSTGSGGGGDGDRGNGGGNRGRGGGNDKDD